MPGYNVSFELTIRARTRKELLPWLAAVCALSAAGTVGALWATSTWGPGVNVDAVIYIDAARHILRGEGLVVSIEGVNRPLVQYPPGFPAAVAGIAGLTGLDEIRAAGVLNAVLLGVTTLGVGSLCLVCTKNRSLSLLCASLYLFNPSTVYVHIWAWSEPLFVALLLAALWTLRLHLLTGRLAPYILCGITVGLSVMVRYVGLALIPAWVLASLHSNGRGRPPRFVHIALFGALAAGPFALLTARNLALASTATGRSLAMHPPSFEIFYEGMWTVAGEWLQPTVLGLQTRWTALIWLALLAATLVSLRREANQPRMPDGLIECVFLFGLTYLALLLITTMVADASTRFDTRLLFPLVPCGLLSAFIFLSSRLRALRPRTITILWISLASILLLSYLLTALATVHDVRQLGVGYTSSWWRKSRVVEALRTMPESTFIFSDRPDAVYFLTERPARSLPPRWSPGTLGENVAFEKEMTRLCEQLANGALVVYFRPPARRYVLSESELTARFPLTAVISDSTGGLYHWKRTILSESGKRCPLPSATSIGRQ